MKRPLLATLLVACILLAGCSRGPSSQDTDEDGLYDQEERDGWVVTIEVLDVERRTYERITYKATSDPKKWDTDGDGISDSDEFFLVPPTDPSKADTDGDGLTDCQEKIHTVLSECEDPNFTGPFDGGYGTEPTSADSDPGPARYISQHFNLIGVPEGSVVSRGDGIPDGVEIAGYTINLPGGGTRTIKTNPINKDHDGDQLEDGEERYVFGSDPTVADTDGDGCPDGFDLFPARSERYRPGLDQFRLKQDADVTGGANLRLRINIANQFLETPSGGQKSINTGDRTDISDLEPAPQRLARCNDPTAARITPIEPWMLVQISAFDMDGNQRESLDIFSQTQGPTAADITATVWWNPRTGQFAWNEKAWSQSGGTFRPTGGTLHFVGTDGELWLKPSVL